MGLDQFARIEDGNERAGRSDTEIARWRKHPNLQGWMEKKYRALGGDQEFNYEKVYLTHKILNELEVDIRKNNLPVTCGFFYGGDSDDYYKERDLKFINDSRGYLDSGYKIYYSSWW